MIRLTLPWPPSANAMWRAIPRGRIAHTILSAPGRKWQKEADAALARQMVGQWAVCDGAVSVVLSMYPPRRGTDLDNRIKPTLDALEGRAFVNDKQVCELHAYRHDPDGNPRVEVEIEEMR